ncbi:hypothetical protein FCV25MIE_02095 [Fagus crenata]
MTSFIARFTLAPLLSRTLPFSSCGPPQPSTPTRPKLFQNNPNPTQNIQVEILATLQPIFKLEQLPTQGHYPLSMDATTSIGSSSWSSPLSFISSLKRLSLAMVDEETR